MSDVVLIVQTTCPDAAVAARIAGALIDARLAACVQVLPGVTSTYRWEGALERADEVAVLIKTTAARYAEVEAAVRALHPYAVPEIVAWPVSAGLPAYLQWVADETRPPRVA
jgi:periplasmic divalent cation tolerance protein